MIFLPSAREDVHRWYWRPHFPRPHPRPYTGTAEAAEEAAVEAAVEEG